MFNGTINEVLFEIAKQLGVQWDKLVAYANDAPYAATRPDGNKWPSGTGSESEKRILYAIAKALQPMEVYDIGTRWGAMTTQILTANPNPKTIVHTIDIESTIHGGGHPVGKFIPKDIVYHQIIADATKWFVTNSGKETVQLIFEDSAHDKETTKKIYRSAIKALAPGGVIISHDACHPKFKGQVVAGIKATGIEPNVYLVEGDSCGLAIWQKPTKDISLKVEIHHEAETVTEAPQEKPKRRKRRRKKAPKTVEKETT